MFWLGSARRFRIGLPAPIMRRCTAPLAEDGATMVEYVIMVASIALVCVLSVTALGQKVLGLFQSVPAF